MVGKWFFQERDTLVLCLLALGASLLLLLLSPQGLAAPSRATGSSWSELGDLSRCVEETVVITGTVLNISQQETLVKMEVMPFVQPIAIVAFPRGELGISEGDVVRIEGRVQEFRGREEVIADKVSVR